MVKEMNPVNFTHKAQKTRGDTQLAVDQLSRGLLRDSQIGDFLKEGREGKKGKKVESASGDTAFQALKTYVRDLVEQAGKHDLVICRDEEIRGVVRMWKLEDELHALEKKDKTSKARLVEVQKELDELKDKLQPLVMKYRKEKESVDEHRKLKQKREELLVELAKAERYESYDFRRVFELRYLDIENVEKAIAKLEGSIATAKVKSEVEKLRGKKGKVGSASGDTAFQALKTNGRDLVEQAGKLDPVIGRDEIRKVVSRWTGISVTRPGQNDKERLIGLEERLHKRVVGQDQAVEAVAGAVLRSEVGLGRPQQPTGSFLFVGTSGVGKTELAKALAEQHFDDVIVRIDMSKYIGHDKGGQLIEAVRRRPYSVVLFDKVEKAHTAIFNTLLKVLKDGRLTDGQGRTVDFKNTVIIMTSNLGEEHILSSMMGKCSMPVARDRVMQEVRRHFMPELLDCLDEIVVFDPLSRNQLRKVASLQMKDVAVRLAKKGIAMTVTDAALDHILDQNYVPVHGARPIRRWPENSVGTKLSRMLLLKEIDENSTVVIDAAHVAPTGTRLVYRVLRRTEDLSMQQRGRSRKC